MKKNLKITLISVLSLGFGLAAFWVFVANPSSGAKPTGPVSRLFEKLGVVKIASGKDPIDVRLPDISGINVDLSDFRGKIVFLNFWATWCPTCVAEMPAMERLHRQMRRKDFAMVAISLQDNAGQVKDFFNKHKLTFTALLDSTGEIGARFGLRVIPTTIILDKTGKTIGIVTGPREWDSREAIALFEQLADSYAAAPAAVAADPG